MKKFKEEVLNILSSNLEGFDNSILSTPPDSTLGDLALPCFKFAKGINPLDYAKNFSNLLNTKLSKYNFIKEIKAVGPYVNFFINREKLLYDIIKNGFLINNENVNKTVVIDYSSPNIAKPIAFHHIRSTVIGHVLGNIFEACGYKVVRINYLGDWGTQFGKIITAFEKYGDYKTLEKEGIKHLLDIYVKYHKEEDEALELEAQKWYELTEKADEKALKYWEKFRDISIKEFKRIYKKLNIDFTFFEGESFYRHSTDKVLDLLDKKIGIKESEGALIIDLSKYDMPPALLKKTNGTTLYMTRDVAAAMDRHERFNFDESLYVVATQQDLHFKQLFKVLELAGFDWFNKCTHINFGMLHFKDSKMSTREGNVIFLEDVLDKSVELALKAIEEKNPNLDNKFEVARDVGIGAIIFSDISKRRKQDVNFNWEEILNFDGETAPYIQYTYARASSLLKKANFSKNKKLLNYEPNDLEFELIKMISDFQKVLEEAKNNYEPFFVARFLLDLSQIFNKYYYQEKIIDIENENIKYAKLSIIDIVKELIKHALSILNINTPERM